MINNTDNFFLDNYILTNLSTPNCRLKIWNIISDREDLLANRLEINEMINKYIKLISPIRKEIDDFADKNFAGKSVLSVHIRTTDYNFTNLPLIIKTIKNILKWNSYDKIFVASDSLEPIRIVCNRFKNACYYETNLRCKKIDSPKPLCHMVFGDEKIKHGRDVLVEAYLLSYGSEMVCIDSNVAGMACYLNPNMKIHLTQRQNYG